MYFSEWEEIHTNANTYIPQFNFPIHPWKGTNNVSFEVLWGKPPFLFPYPIEFSPQMRFT